MNILDKCMDKLVALKIREEASPLWDQLQVNAQEWEDDQFEVGN